MCSSDLTMRFSSAVPISGTSCTVEDLAKFSGRVQGERVRVLSKESMDALALLERGVSVDRRPLAANGAVEAARWLHEQAVSVTNHRYGNVGAGPQPRIG